MTTLSANDARRRFLAMLWLSAALHAAVIGFARLPPPVRIALPPELQVRLEAPARQAPPAESLPEPKPAPAPPRPVQPVPTLPPKAESVIQPAPVPAPIAPVIAQPPAPTPQVASAAVSAPVRETPGPQLNIPLAVDTRYYTAKELDMPPSALRKTEPVYPPQAEDQKVPGRVVVRLHLEADGSVSKTEVVSMTPGGVFGELFRKSTLDSLRGLRFRPAQRNGQPVRAVVEIPVTFEPDR